MGRITIFTENDCEASQAVKERLMKVDVAFTEINLSNNQKRRRDMIELCQNLETPQIFFNNEHVGSSKKFLELMISWEDDVGYSAYNSLKERIQHEVLNKEPPDNILLRCPKSKAESDSSQNNSGDLINEILLPNGNVSDVCKLTLLLMKHLPKSTSIHKTKLMNYCFSGKSLVQTLKKLDIASTDEEASDFAQKLQNLQIFHSASKNQTFDIKSNSYRLQPFLNPNVMNSFCFWISYTGSGEMLEKPLKVLSDLRKMLDGALKAEETGNSGKIYDSTISNEPSFNHFEQQVCKLQLVDIGNFDTRTRVAFFINLYNLMTAHGMRRFGVEKLSSKYLSTLKYNIGGYLLSFNDILHGILRANYPYSEKKIIQFRPSDDRCKLIVPGLDKRIHFALDRGGGMVAGSYQFTREAVDLELQHVSELYCAQDTNIHIDPNENELILPIFMKPCIRDFSKSKKKLPKSIYVYLKDEKLKTLQDMLFESKSQEKEIKIKFSKYPKSHCCDPEKLDTTSRSQTINVGQSNDDAPRQSATPSRKSSVGKSLRMTKNLSPKKLKGILLHMDRSGHGKKESKYVNTQSKITSASNPPNYTDGNIVKEAQALGHPEIIPSEIFDQSLTWMRSTKDQLNHASAGENFKEEQDVSNRTTLVQNDIKPTDSGDKEVRNLGTTCERTVATEEETLNIDVDICPTKNSVATSGSVLTFGDNSINSGDVVTRLSSLANLKNIGALTDAEFRAAKAIVLGESSLLTDKRYNDSINILSDEGESGCKSPAKKRYSEKAQTIEEGEDLLSCDASHTTDSSKTWDDKSENSNSDVASDEEASYSSLDTFSIDYDEDTISGAVALSTKAPSDDIVETGLKRFIGGFCGLNHMSCLVTSSKEKY